MALELEMAVPPTPESTYFQTVDEALESTNRRLISNGKPEHAAYLIRRFFEKAERDVRMFSGSLAQTVDGVPVFSSPDIIDAARAFLRRRNTELHIILADDLDVDPGTDPKRHPFLQGVWEEHLWGFLRGRMTLGRAAKRDAEFQHFQVMDDAVCRVETGEHGSSIKALVAFGDTELCESAARTFDRIRRNAKPVFAVP